MQYLRSNNHTVCINTYISVCASASTAAPYFVAGYLSLLLSRRRMEYAATVEISLWGSVLHILQVSC